MFRGHLSSITAGTPCSSSGGRGGARGGGKYRVVHITLSVMFWQGKCYHDKDSLIHRNFYYSITRVLFTRHKIFLPLVSCHSSISHNIRTEFLTSLINVNIMDNLTDRYNLKSINMY